MHWIFFVDGVKFQWGSKSLDFDESPSSLLIIKKKDIEYPSQRKKKKKNEVQDCESQLVFFFLINDKLQITPFKFKDVWILHAKILELEFNP